MARYEVKDRVAVITGAASGIGRGTALALAKRGSHLALADVNEAGLAETAVLVAPYGVKVTCHRLDVANADEIAAFPEKIRESHGRVDILVNNAGVALGGYFEQVTPEDFDWLLSINLHGVINMTRAFLPMLSQSDDARIVNLSSIYGIIAPPGQTAYTTAKFAVRGFTMSLRHELQNTKIGVTVVHPGGVATSIAKSARIAASVPKEEAAAALKLSEKLLRMPPDKAGEIIVSGIEKRKTRIMVGFDAKLVALLERLFPVHYWSVFRVMGLSGWEEKPKP